MADTLEARVTDIPGDNPQIITYGYGDRLIILDKDSEIPALFHYVFRRPDNAYLPGLWARIVRIYSDTTGIDFISSSEDNPDYSYGDYVYYYRRAVSGDGNIELVMVVEGKPVIKSVYASKTEETETIEYDEQKDWTLDIFVISTVSSLI